MKDIITERIKELVKEINVLLENRERAIAQVNHIDSDISAKQGAIYELKGILDTTESSTQSEESDQDKT